MGRKKQYFDVILVQPNITWVYDPFEHLGLAYLAAALRQAGFQVKIVDAVLMKLSMSELYQELNQYDIGVLGVTLISHGYSVTCEFLEYYRKQHPETKIVGGGHFATFASDKILKDTNAFDAIVLGEGEYTFVDYCKAVLWGERKALLDIATSGEEILRSKQRILDMDTLPFPSRDTLPMAISAGATPSITASRGCYAQCSFCTVHSFYKVDNGPRWVSRSIDNVIEELKNLYAQFNINHFMFIDDNFMGPGAKGREKAMAFARAYKRSKLPMTFHLDCRAVDVDEDVIRMLQSVGLRSVFVGVESVDPNDLKVYRKGNTQRANTKAINILDKYNIKYTISMIMFNPLTSKQSILSNIRFLKDIDYFPRNPVSLLNLYEGTDLVDVFEEHRYGPFWNYRFKFADIPVSIIYGETLKFCKDTLPFERKLSSCPGGCFEERSALYKLRLLFLENLTRSFGREPVEDVYAHWQEQVSRLEQNFERRSGSLIDSRMLDTEQPYMTGSPLDPPVTS